MKIAVSVKPNAKENRVEKTGSACFAVRVKARPRQGRANEAVIEVLAEYFGIAKSQIRLLRGRASRQKMFEVD